MSNITEILFPAPARRTSGAILRWWECRRLAYNAVVGIAGLFSLGVVNLLFVIPPGPHTGGLPIAAVVIVGIAANVCYLMGPAAEIAIEKLGGGRILPTGPALYRMGLTFSTGLVMLPTLVAGFYWLIRLVRWVF
jgi:hypothetical protein